MSLLLTLQQRHVRLTGQLIDYIYLKEGASYSATWGQTLRDPATAMMNAVEGSGIAHSLHLIKLAVDLSIFKDGYLLKTVEDYRPFGEFWESLEPLCCWGGRFAKPDADHFSITFGGVK